MDNKKLKGYQDDHAIDSKDRSELRDRANKWGYSAGAIVIAIYASGSSNAKIVREWLRKNWKRIIGCRKIHIKERKSYCNSTNCRCSAEKF